MPLCCRESLALPLPRFEPIGSTMRGRQQWHPQKRHFHHINSLPRRTVPRPCLTRVAAAKTATLVRLRVMGYYVGRTGTGERYVSRDPGKASHGAFGLSIQDALSGNSSLRPRGSVRRSRARVRAPREALPGRGARPLPSLPPPPRPPSPPPARPPSPCSLPPHPAIPIH